MAVALALGIFVLALAGGFLSSGRVAPWLVPILVAIYFLVGYVDESNTPEGVESQEDLVAIVGLGATAIAIAGSAAGIALRRRRHSRE